MTLEVGHNTNRQYDDALGNLHLNGANLLDVNEKPVAQNVTFSIAQGASSNISLITLQVTDGAGVAIAAVFEMSVWLSDAATGAGLTATTASGAVGAGAAGTDVQVKSTKKSTDVLTDATGKYILSITDTSKTLFFIATGCPGTGNVLISRQLVAGDYK